MSKAEMRELIEAIDVIGLNGAGRYREVPGCLEMIAMQQKEIGERMCEALERIADALETLPDRGKDA